MGKHTPVHRVEPRVARRLRQHDNRENRILEALPTAERIRLSGQLTPIALPIKTVLFEPGQEIDAVYLACPLEESNLPQPVKSRLLYR